MLWQPYTLSSLAKEGGALGLLPPARPELPGSGEGRGRGSPHGPHIWEPAFASWSDRPSRTTETGGLGSGCWSQLESQLTRRAVWGRHLTSLGLFHFLSSGVAWLVLVLGSESYVLSACCGTGPGRGAAASRGGTSIANPRDRASSAVAPARSPAPTGKGASPLSLGVRGGLELCARPEPREDPHSTPPGGRWSLDVEEETGVHQLQQLSPRPPSPARHQTDPPPVGGCGTTPRTKSVETRPSSRAGVGEWQSGVTLGDRHHLLVVPSPPDRQADARRRHPASASLVGAPAGPTPQASQEPFPPGPAPDMAVGRQGQARERVTAAREPRCGLR